MRPCAFPTWVHSQVRSISRKYGKRVDYAHIPEQYLKYTTVKDGFQTCTYQAQLLHKDFPVPLNVVILVKTNLATQASATSFCSAVIWNCPLRNWSIITALRFQIEFNFRDAKQFWGLEDFMNVNANCRYQCRQPIFVYGQSISSVNVRCSDKPIPILVFWI